MPLCLEKQSLEAKAMLAELAFQSCVPLQVLTLQWQPQPPSRTPSTYLPSNPSNQKRMCCSPQINPCIHIQSLSTNLSLGNHKTPLVLSIYLMPVIIALWEAEASRSPE
ncbi:hypothetical protein AAY473_011497, partial [Plecturocebus cupreus]